MNVFSTFRSWSAPVLGAMGVHAVAVFSALSAAEWPAFRGPQGSGESPDATLADGLKIRWSVPLQDGVFPVPW